MTGYDDDERDMVGGFDLDSGGGSSAQSSAAVAQLIDDLRGLAEQEPPPPSPELAAVLAGTARPPHVRRPARARVVAAVAACAVLGGAGVAAAQGRLPQPAQRVVSDVVDTITPFTVPARSEPELPERGVPGQPVHRPVVGPPPGAGRRSADDTGGSGPSQEESPGDRSSPGEQESPGGQSDPTEGSSEDGALGPAPTSGAAPQQPRDSGATERGGETSGGAGGTRERGDSGGAGD